MHCAVCDAQGCSLTRRQAMLSSVLCRQCQLSGRSLRVVRAGGRRSLSLSSVRCTPQWWATSAEWISQSWSTKLLQDGFVALHDVAHLPWWAAIVAGTVGLRLATAPLGIWGERLIGQRTLMELAVHTNVAKDVNDAVLIILYQTLGCMTDTLPIMFNADK